jgi:hypothetical protein
MPVPSGFDSTMGVYTGSSVDNLNVVASDNDSGGNLTSRVGFHASAGTTYYIAIDGVSGASGNISLNWGLLPRLTIQRASATSMRLTLAAGQGAYDIEASSDLTQWTRLTTLTLTGGAQQYTDTTAGNANHRFYRAIISH